MSAFIQGWGQVLSDSYTRIERMAPDLQPYTFAGKITANVLGRIYIWQHTNHNSYANNLLIIYPLCKTNVKVNARDWSPFSSFKISLVLCFRYWFSIVLAVCFFVDQTETN
jgi:hypothetical protein